MDTKQWINFQICISVPLISFKNFEFQIKLVLFETWNFKFWLTAENKVFPEKLWERYSSCSMLKISAKYLNLGIISKTCIRAEKQVSLWSKKSLIMVKKSICCNISKINMLQKCQIEKYAPYNCLILLTSNVVLDYLFD